MRKIAMFFVLTIICLSSTLSFVGHSKEIIVGLEPFPPLINEDGGGMLVDMLSTLSTGHEIQFKFLNMTYGRAKKDLKNNKLQLIGLTPHRLETEAFYQYAKELEWHIDTHVDFYSLDKTYFNVENLPDGSIGTPIGNAEFFSQIIGVPVSKFVEVSSLQQLVKMLALGRLKVILFERVSIVSTLKSAAIQNVFYQEMGIVSASMAVANTPEGTALKKRLDDWLLTTNNEQFFKEFIHHSLSKKSGQVLLE